MAAEPVQAWAADLAERMDARRAAVADRPFMIGLAGPVASGKSTAAGHLAEALRGGGLRVEIVATDGFLFANAALAERGLMERKGRVESHDLERLARFMAEAADGAPEVTVPVYSHETYDVAGERSFPRPEVLIVEGLLGLHPAVSPLDMGLYVQADEDDLFGWYLERFLRLRRHEAPRLAERLAAVGGDTRALARDIWERVNRPVNEEAAPSAARADVILRAGSDHEIRLISGR